MPYSEFIFEAEEKKPLDSGEVTWKVPSNIALVKYWGKHGIQLPKNPSLSFTLSNSFTETKLEFTPSKEPESEIAFDIYFEGEPSAAFRPKIADFFKRIATYVPFIKEYSYSIHTKNSFPHSSGIASSASGMAALALCIMSMEAKLNPELSQEDFNKKASFLARLGSGSAARSIEGPATVWGEHPAVKGSSDLFAVKTPFKIHEVFEGYQDSILIVDKGQKKVSSTLGHDLMNGHAFAENRYDQAFVHMELLIDILKKGKVKEFIKLVENEALTLHAMMMTSSPYFLLMKPNTINVIETIWEHREKTGSSICFTLDAGANVHVLYPENEKEETVQFIETELSKYCEDGKYILDEMGNGAIKKEEY